MLGIVAFIISIVGFIFACIPGALIIGWILLPIAFILALVSLFLKGKGKALGITGLIISVVGTIVGAVVFFAVVTASFNDAFGGGETTAAVPEDTTTEETTDADEEAPAEDEQGTRANPYPIGTAVTQGDWTVTINSVTLNANDAIAAENPFNEAPAEGTQYMMANLTATYNGDDEEGTIPMLILDYVTADGNTINSYDTIVVPPEQFDSIGTLYPDASTTGNIAFQIPSDTAGDGVLALQADILGDKVFVAVQ